MSTTARPEEKGSGEMEIRRGVRCGLCYWSLYDGDWCQNPSCAVHGKSVTTNRIHLSNQEAQILIAAFSAAHTASSPTSTGEWEQEWQNALPVSKGDSGTGVSIPAEGDCPHCGLIHDPTKTRCSALNNTLAASSSASVSDERKGVGVEAPATQGQQSEETGFLPSEIANALDAAGVATGNEHGPYTLLERVRNLIASKNYFARQLDESRDTVNRVWKALDIATYAEAGGKAIWEIVASRVSSVSKDGKGQTASELPANAEQCPNCGWPGYSNPECRNDASPAPASPWVREDTERLDWLCLQVVEVREPLRWGSRQLFLESPEDNEGETDSPSQLREAIDKAMLPALPVSRDAEEEGKTSQDVGPFCF